MQPNIITVSLLIFLGVFILFFVLSDPLLKLLGFIIKTIIGGGLIYLCNIIFSPFGISVGVNLLTSAFVGFLGIPGIGSLILISHILFS